MKRIALLLSLFCFATYCMGEKEQLQDNQRIPIYMNRSRCVLGHHGEVITPNYKAEFVKSEDAATSYGIVSISGDTLRIKCYAIKTNQLEKIETYDAKGYFKNGGNLVVTGKQSYYVDGRLLCDEIYKNGQFKSTEWYTSKGEKERAYMYRNDHLAQKIQFYPSGRLKWMEIYLPNGTIQQQVYTEDKKVAEIQEPFFPEGYEAFERYFNQLFRTSYQRLSEGEYAVDIYVGEDGRCEMMLWDNDIKNGANVFATPHLFSDNRMPLWTPAMIDGKPVAYSMVRKITYNPLLFKNDGDTFRIAPSYGEACVIKGFKWHDCRLWMPSSMDTCTCYAIYHRLGDTIRMDCYSAEHQLFQQQTFVYAPDDIPSFKNTETYHKSFKQKVYEQTGGYRLYSFRTYNDGKLNQYEHWIKDTLEKAVWYYPNGQIRYEVIPKEDNGDLLHTYEKLTEFYPTGEIKATEQYKEKNSDGAVSYTVTYYDRQGNCVKPKMPKCPGDAGRLRKFVARNLKIKETPFYMNLWTQIWGNVEIFVEVDESGNPHYIGSGKCTINWQGAMPKFLANQIVPLILDCLQKDTDLWFPGTINGEPTTLRTVIRVPFSFTK